MSQAVEGMWIRTGGYGQFRGKWVEFTVFIFKYISDQFFFHVQTGSTDPYCFVEFETRESAEQALFAMNNRNVYEKVSKGIMKDLNNKFGHVRAGKMI